MIGHMLKPVHWNKEKLCTVYPLMYGYVCVFVLIVRANMSTIKRRNK